VRRKKKTEKERRLNGSLSSMRFSLSLSLFLAALLSLSFSLLSSPKAEP